MFAAVAGLALVLSAAPPKGRWEAQWKKARAMTAALDFEGALPLLRSLVTEPEVPPVPRAEMLLELGITHINLGDDAAAASAFRKALTFDPSTALPPLAPPKAMQLLEQERAKLPPSPDPTAAGPPPARAAPAVPKLVPAPREAVVVSEPEPQPASRPWLGVALSGAGAAVSLVAGVTLAFESQRVARQLETMPRLADEVVAMRGQRDAFSAGAITGYAVAGLLAVVAAVLLITSL